MTWIEDSLAQLADTEQEWEVTWFPPDRPDVTHVYKTERVALVNFEEAKRQGFIPILCVREITTTPWMVVRNAVEEEDDE